MSNRFEDSEASLLPRHRKSEASKTQAAAARNALKFNHMRMIAAIDQHANLSAAATFLNISQPAASRMVAEMEAIVDAPLLERHARGVTLTPYGAALARRARSILIELNQVDHDISDLRTGRGGNVSLGAVTAPAIDLAIPAIQALRQRFPRLGITIQVEASPILARDLLASRHDFIIARIPEDMDARLFESQVIGIEKACFLVRRGHPLISGDGRAGLEAAREFEWVLQPSGTMLRRAIEEHFQRRDLPLPESVLSTSSLLLTLAMLIRTDAIAAVSVEVANFLRSTKGLNASLEVLPINFEIEVHPYSLITVTNRTLSPAARLVYDAILEQLG